MLSHCPVCGARQPGAASCRRCGSGLELLFDIIRRGQELERQAVAALGSGQREQARECLRQAIALHATPLARALLDFTDHDDVRRSPPVATNETQLPHAAWNINAPQDTQAYDHS